VNARNAAHYISAYLGRGALSFLPEGSRRYGSSADVDLDPRSTGDDEESEWILTAYDRFAEGWMSACSGDFVRSVDRKPPPD
jgi:hypothetical protein